MLTVARTAAARTLCLRAAVGARAYSSSKREVDVNNYPPRGRNTVFNVVPKGYTVSHERFGRLLTFRKPGWFLALPFIDRITNVVDMREITIPIEPQWGTTRDNVSVKAGGALYVRVLAPENFCYNVRRPLTAIKTLAISSMRSAIGSVDLDTLFHDRTTLNAKILLAMSQEKIHEWGMVCGRYELTEVEADDAVQKAMDLQSVAERDRRKEVLNAEADKTAMIMRSEGKKQHFINLAEGKKQQVILEAESIKESILLKAEADRQAIALLASTLDTPEGRRAQDYLLGKGYLDTLASVLPSSKLNTVFLPNNIGDLPKLMATATGILGSDRPHGWEEKK